MLRAVILLLLLLHCLAIQAQGCSDAGVCTAGPIGTIPTTADSSVTLAGQPHSFRTTFSYGIGERGVVELQVVPQLDLRLGERFSVQLKVPYMSTSGDLGGTSGLGDPVASTSFNLQRKKNIRLDALLGLKFPVNDANAMQDGRPLPMPYQTSLGSTDLLLGLSHRWRRWQSALAYQHVLHHGNRNEFTHSIWMDDMRALGYFESRHLRRANDAVARLQYTIPVNRLSIQPGLLAIQHLGRDRRLQTPVDPAGMPRIPGQIDVDGSEGLTLNLTLDAQYKLSEQWSLLFAYGSPVITREVRPDGLTRFMVLNMALVHSFGR